MMVDQWSAPISVLNMKFVAYIDTNHLLLETKLPSYTKMVGIVIALSKQKTKHYNHRPSNG